MNKHRSTIIDFNKNKIPFMHRGTRADTGVLKQIFVQKQYQLSRLRRGGELNEFYDSVVNSGGQPLIVDCGANIGASALWFSMAFPKSFILGLEPDFDNFELLSENTVSVNGKFLNAAVGSIDKMTYVVDPGLGEWGYRTSDLGAGNMVEMMSMRRLVAESVASGKVPFIAKIDIEGGEEELFMKHTEWIDYFPLLIIELHDWLLPKSGNSRSFLREVSSRDRDFVYSGENIFSIRNF